MDKFLAVVTTILAIIAIISTIASTVVLVVSLVTAKIVTGFIFIWWVLSIFFSAYFVSLIECDKV